MFLKLMNYLTALQSRYFQEKPKAPEPTPAAKVKCSDDKAKVVAAIAAAIHHHELENAQNGSLLGVAAVVAAIHHHNNLKK
jgi:Na+-transporting methylmalonyl-CoA/oxaloacetate decarboxylase gamma subunit